MSSEDWLLAAKAEEQRLLDEISKTELYKQLDAVRTVIAVYQGSAVSPAAAPVQTPAATVVSTQANGPASERGYKTTNYLRNPSMTAAAPSGDAAGEVDRDSKEADRD
jgi:hypothetical protein